MSVLVVAPKAAGRTEMTALFRAATPKVHAEPGCELYALRESETRC